MELMKLATEILTRRISYDVPDQNLEINWSRLPPLPEDRFVIDNIRMA